MANSRNRLEDWLDGDNLILLMGWSRDGLSNAQIANNIGISEATFYRWCDKDERFERTIKKNRECLNFEIENVLVEMCREKNTAAIIFYLKNRMPHKWKDKVEQQITTDIEDTTPLADLLKFTDDEKEVLNNAANILNKDSVETI